MPEKKRRCGRMGADKTFAVVFHEGQEVGTLLRRQVDLPDTEKKDCVEVVQVADVEFLAGGDSGAVRKRDRVPGDQLRISADECVVTPGLTSKVLDCRNG